MNLASLFVRGVMALLVTFLLLSATTLSWAQEAPVPAFTSWVTDTTNTISAPDKAQLTQKLAALDSEKGAQIAVLMIPTTQNESIESYAARAFAQWQLGRKDVDDGILLVVAKEDRRLRIEVGYGLEGAVPDVLAGRIIREQITPHFRTGEYSTGVVAGVDSLIALVQGESLPPPADGAGQGSQDDNSPWFLLLALAFMAVIMPLGIPTVFIGVFAAIGFGSALMGIACGVGAAFLGILVRRLGFGNTRQTIAASRRGGGRLGRASKYGAGGFGAGGGFGGGMGGGFGGGGGGSSGGGGASGSW